MKNESKQQQQNEWYVQWQTFDRDEELFLFEDWIAPNKLQDFEGKDVLEAGCGGGPHTSLLVKHARHVTAVDLNTTALARRRLAGVSNVEFIEDDIASMDLQRYFDVVFCIAVVHHTDDPDKTVANLKRHVKPGGTIVLWVYTKEGNALVEYIVEPVRKFALRHLSRQMVLGISKVVTVLLYIPVHTLYRAPLPFMPYYEYFGNFRKLPFNRNCLNVFDKLNAPQVEFITQARAKAWFNCNDFELTHLNHYKKVSWRLTARRRMAKDMTNE